MVRRSTRKMKRSKRSRTRRQRGGANGNNAPLANIQTTLFEDNNNNNSQYYARLFATQSALNRRGLSTPNSNTMSTYSNNNKNVVSRKLEKLVLPKNTENAISTNTIKSGNELVNFRGNAPNSFESKFGRYYKANTFSQLFKHPQTRGPIVEPKHYKAKIEGENENENSNENETDFNTKRIVFGGRRKRTRKNKRLVYGGRMPTFNPSNENTNSNSNLIAHVGTTFVNENTNSQPTMNYDEADIKVGQLGAALSEHNPDKKILVGTFLYQFLMGTPATSQTKEDMKEELYETFPNMSPIELDDEVWDLLWIVYKDVLSNVSDETFGELMDVHGLSNSANTQNGGRRRKARR
jgi:hypothetical protein